MKQLSPEKEEKSGTGSCLLLPVFSWRHVKALLKGTVECAQTGETGIHGKFSNRKRGVLQQPKCTVQTKVI